jgi:hypothetical protein
MPTSGYVLLMPGAGDANPSGRRCENTYCSSQQDEQGPLSYPDGSQVGICSPNFKFELGLVEPNRTAIALDRDLADV